MSKKLSYTLTENKNKQLMFKLAISEIRRQTVELPPTFKKLGILNFLTAPSGLNYLDFVEVEDS